MRPTETPAAEWMEGIREAARRYSDRGIRPMSVKPEGKAANKKDWKDIATTDMTSFDVLFWEPHSNIGIAMGEWADPNSLFGGDSWLLGLDIDIKNGKRGDEEIAALEAKHGELPATWTAITPSGGTHLIFRSPVEIGNSQTRGNAIPDVDIRGEGGYLCVEPTVIVNDDHPNGGEYRWEVGHSPFDIEVADAPGWLIEILTAEPEPERKPEPSLPSNTASTKTKGPADYLRDVWVWETELRKDRWTLSKTKRDGNQMWTRPDKNPKDGHSASLHPGGPLVVFSSSVPPGVWEVGEPTPNGEAVSLSPYDYELGFRHGGEEGKKAAARAIMSRPDVKAIVEAETADWDMGANSTPLTDTDDDESDEEHDGLLIDWSTINDRPEAIIDGLIFPSRWTAIYGEPKQGKSTLLLGLSLAAANGYDPITNTFRDPVNVLYCDGEMGRFDLAERLDDFGHTPEHLDTELPGWHATDATLKLGNTATANRIIALVNEHNIGLVILDGLNTFLDGEENSSGPIIDLFEATVKPLKKLNVAIVSGDNSGKDKHKGSRGSSAKNDKPDGVLLLTQKEHDGVKGLELTRQMARTSAYPPKTQLKVLNLDTSDPTKIAPTNVKGYVKGTRELADQIDALDNIGELKSQRAIKKALREKDIKFGNDVFQDAMRYRASGARRDPFHMGGDEG